MTSAPPETTTPAPTGASQPPEVARGLWALTGALLLLAFWAQDTLLAAPGALLFALAMIPATRTLGEHGRWARWTAAGVVLLAVLVVAVGTWDATEWTLLLWAGVVGSLVWAALGWERTFAERQDEDLYVSWWQLHQRGLLLVHLLVLGGGVALAAPEPTTGWAGLLLLPLLIFGLVWGLEALKTLSATARSVSARPPRRSMGPAGVLLVVAGMVSGGFITGPTLFADGSVVVDAEQGTCELRYARAGQPLHTEQLKIGNVLTREFDPGFDRVFWRESVGPYEVTVRDWQETFEPTSHEVSYEFWAPRPLALASRVREGTDGVSVSGFGVGTVDLTCRPDVAMPPGSAPAP